MAKFNLDNIIGKCVHRPIASKDPDKMPLYKRNDGIFNADGSVGTRSDAWLKASEHIYSSPNNIRRVFITYKGVYVHYYRPIVGDSSKETAKFYSYDSINSDFKPLELRESILRGDFTDIVTKSGFGAFKGQWSCTNVEEIYFDWTLLLSSELQQLGLGNLLVHMCKTGTSGIQDGSILMSLFTKFCLKPGENISRTFPRLKIIGYVSELETLYLHTKRKPGEESAEDLLNAWYKNPVVGQAIKSPNVYVALYKVPNVSALNNKFMTRSFYSYDMEVLEPYFATMKQKILKAMSEKRLAKEAVKKSDFEKLLDDIKATKGIEAARRMCTIMALSTESNENTINTLSEEGKALYLSNGGGNND